MDKETYKGMSENYRILDVSAIGLDQRPVPFAVAWSETPTEKDAVFVFCSRFFGNTWIQSTLNPQEWKGMSDTSSSQLLMQALNHIEELSLNFPIHYHLQ